MTYRWRRHEYKDWLYELIVGGTVVATVERHDPPNNSHYSIWTIQEIRGAQFTTKRDAQAYALSILGGLAVTCAECKTDFRSLKFLQPCPKCGSTRLRKEEPVETPDEKGI